MKQKGKNRKFKARMLAWLLTLVMVLGLTNGLTLPVQAAESDSFEVTLNPTTGALETIKYTFGNVDAQSGSLETYLVLWDADDKSQGVLVSDSLKNSASGGTIVLQCGNNTAFGKRYRIAKYSILTPEATGSGTDPNTQFVPSDWPSIGVEKVYDADNFSATRTVKMKIGSETYTYTGDIGDALKPHYFDYVASGITKTYDGLPAQISVAVRNFPFNTGSLGNAALKTLYKGLDGEYTETVPSFEDAGEYEVEFKLSFPELGYETVTDSRIVKIEPVSASLKFQDPSNRTIILPPENISVLKIANPASSEQWIGTDKDKDPISYSSSDTSVATVNDEGTVSVLAAGETTITATVTPGKNYTYDNTAVSYRIVVSKTPITVEFTKQEVNAFVGIAVEENPLIRKKDGNAITLDTGWTVTYSSSSEAVATVAENGVVTALSEGETTITATIADGPNYDHEPETVSYHLTVSKIPINVKFSDGTTDIEEKTIFVNGTIEDVKIYYQNNANGEWVSNFLGDGAVTLSSSDEDVATVDENGKVIGISEGTAIITATFTETNQCRYIPNAISYTVNVEKIPINVRLKNDESETIFIDDTIDDHIVQYQNLADGVWYETKLGDGSVAFSSSDEEVAMVDENGTVTGVGEGEATITVTFTDSNQCKYIPNTLSYDVTVNKIPWGIYYEPSEVDKFRDEEVNDSDVRLKYYDYRSGTVRSTLSPAGDGKFTYTSSDESVATVDTNGKVTITGAGTTEITATVEDGDKYTYFNKNTASFTLIVSKRKGKIVWDTTEFSGDESYTKRVTFGEDSFTIPAKKVAADESGLTGGDGIISYYTSDPKVATVDASTGKVTIVGAGETKVYATVSDTDVFTYASCGNQIEYTLTVNKRMLEEGENKDYTKPAKREVEYSGSAQELVIPGKAAGNHNHKFYYALGDANTAPATGWSTSVPKAMEAGTYYVWWKIVAESNYYNVPQTEGAMEAEGFMLTSKITPKNVAAAGSNVTVSLTDAGQFTYDGTSKAPSLLVKDGQKTIDAGSYKVNFRKKEASDWGTQAILAENVIEVGTYKAVVIFNGNYKGSIVSGEFEIVKADAAVVSAPKVRKLAYTGTAQRLIDAGETADGTMLYLVSEEKTATMPGTGNEYSDVALVTGTNAGTYYVWWWIEGDGNHNNNAPQSLAVTIDPAATYLETTYSAGWVYDGTDKKPGEKYEIYRASDQVKLGTSEYTVSYQKKNGSSWEDVEQVVDAGEYQITFTMTSGNYASPPSTTITVKKANSDLTAPQAIANLTYDGTAKALVTEGSAVGTDNQMLYAVNKSATTAPTSWSEVIPTATDAGTYQVWYKSTGDKNHNEEVCGSPVKVSIAPKAAASLNITTEPETFVYNGRAQVPNSYLVKDGDRIVTTYSVTSYKKGDDAIDASAIKEVGDYKAVLTFAGNYSGTADVSFSITEAPIVVTVKPSANAPLVYNGTNGTAQTLVVAGKCSDNGTMQYAVTNDTTEPQNWSEDLPKGTNAGTYYVWYKGSTTDANHSDSVPAYIEVEIAPKDAFGNADITAKAETDTFEYNGNAPSLDVTVKDGESAISSENYEISSYQRIDGSMWVTVTAENVVEVGTYKAIITLKGNYKGQREVAFVIEKATAGIKTSPVLAMNLTYNGQAQDLLTSCGETENGTLMFAASDSSETVPVTGWSTASPTGVDAGEYYIWYRIVGDENHKDLPATCLETPVAIQKAEGACTVEAKPVRFTYDGTAKTPVITSVKVGEIELTESEYTVAYKKSGNVVAQKEVIEAGEYTLVVSPTNYTGTGKVEFTIAEPKPRFVGHSLVLTGSIGVNFYMELPDIPGYVYNSVEFTVDGQTKTVALDRNARSAEGYYRFTCEVNALQMAENIHAEFNYSVDGEAAEPVTNNYSVKNYVDEQMIENFDEKTKALINAIAEYGHYAEAYLKDGVSAMPGGSLTPSDIDKAKAAVASKGISIKRSSKVSKVSFSLFLDSDTRLRLYFTTVASFKGTPTVTVDGKTWTWDTEDNKRYYVDIPNIAANKLGTAYTVKFKTGTVTTTVTVSALSYAKAVFDQAEPRQDAVEAMTALYNYYKAAIAYKS